MDVTYEFTMMKDTAWELNVMTTACHHTKALIIFVKIVTTISLATYTLKILK